MDIKVQKQFIKHRFWNIPQLSICFRKEAQYRKYLTSELISHYIYAVLK
jgi:hypothetical protein